MGGTFDPIHNGHLILAEYARVEFDLDDILFIPTGNPPHKDLDGISLKDHRYEMTSLAIKSNPHFQISDIEIRQEKTTYTVDTIESLRKSYEDRELYFILGADSFSNIHLWKDYKRLLTLCNIIIAKRLDTDNEKLNKKLNELSQVYRDSLYVLESPLIEISSTEIRNRIKKGISTKYLVPELVESYIEKNGLYQK